MKKLTYIIFGIVLIGCGADPVDDKLADNQIQVKSDSISDSSDSLFLIADELVEYINTHQTELNSAIENKKITIDYQIRKLTKQTDDIENQRIELEEIREHERVQLSIAHEEFELSKEMHRKTIIEKENLEESWKKSKELLAHHDEVLHIAIIKTLVIMLEMGHEDLILEESEYSKLIKDHLSQDLVDSIVKNTPIRYTYKELKTAPTDGGKQKPNKKKSKKNR